MSLKNKILAFIKDNYTAILGAVLASETSGKSGPEKRQAAIDSLVKTVDLPLGDGLEGLIWGIMIDLVVFGANSSEMLLAAAPREMKTETGTETEAPKKRGPGRPRKSESGPTSEPTS